MHINPKGFNKLKMKQCRAYELSHIGAIPSSPYKIQQCNKQHKANYDLPCVHRTAHVAKLKHYRKLIENA